jgi:uncharacterized protein YkwD
MRKLCFMAVLAGLAITSESQACGLIRSLFGGRCSRPAIISTPPCGTCQSSPTALPPNATVIPSRIPASIPGSAPSCPNGQCPNVVSRVGASFQLGPINAGFGIGVISLHNAERVRHGLPPLVEDPTLTEAAQAQADAQASSGRMFHARTLAGSAENVAAGQTSESEVNSSWMNSSGHRQNILNGSFTRVGVGRSGNYWAVQFGR